MCDYPFEGTLLEEFKFSMPNISLPKISVPKINLPKINLGSIDVAKIDVAKIDPAKIDVGKIDVGTIDVNKIDPAKIDPAKLDPAKLDPAKIAEPKVGDSPPVDKIAAASQAEADAAAAKKKSLAGGEPETKKTVTEKAKSWLSENKKLVAGGLTAAIIASVALARWQQKDGRQFGIVSIEPDEDGVLIRVADGEAFSTDDWVDVSGSNSSPSVDGVGLLITRVVSRNAIVIPGTVTVNGNTGTLTLHTTFESQLKGTISDAVAGVVDTAQIVAAGAIEGAADALDLGSVLDYLKKWAVPVIIVVVLILVLFFVVPRFK
jgi:hypothetical protein